MVGAVTSHEQVAAPRPLVAELLGPAGAGKTTLLRALRRQRHDIAAEIPIDKIGHLPYLAGHLRRFLPVFLRSYRHGRWFTWRETRFMVYVPRWHDQLRRRAPARAALTLLDHGPLFRLVMLREFGPPLTQSQAYAHWWEGMFERWAATLDCVIWLDAPDELLAQRIEARGTRHQVRGKAEHEVAQFLTRYRRAYEQCLAKLEARGGPAILRLDSARYQPDQLAELTLATLDTIAHSNNRRA